MPHAGGRPPVPADPRRQRNPSTAVRGGCGVADAAPTPCQRRAPGGGLAVPGTTGIPVADGSADAEEETMTEETMMRGRRADALDTIARWAASPGSPPCALLLGGTGMGKTTTLRAPQGRLRGLRGRDGGIPATIRLDLEGVGDLMRSDMAAAEVLDVVLRHTLPHGVLLTGEEVVRLVRSEGVVALVDSLDAVLCRMTPAQGRRFARNLVTGLLPAPGSAGRPGRVVVACRSNRFRTARDAERFLPEACGAARADWTVWHLMPLARERAVHAVGALLGMPPSGVEVAPGALAQL